MNIPAEFAFVILAIASVVMGLLMVNARKRGLFSIMATSALCTGIMVGSTYAAMLVITGPATI